MTPEHVGPYRLEGKLGRGGMGVVYAAWDERLRRRVALKQLLPEVMGDPRRRERMRREARAIARLDHPAIVQIHDLLETAEGDWIVMQYVEGPTLAKRLERGHLPAPEVVALARDVAGALAAAHAQGLLHRDLKAENIILTPTGAKVLDFGLAKLYLPKASAAEPTVDLTVGIVGTYRAMSPEQANCLELDPRADLFSLGTLLYEAATAVSPFKGATPVATMTRVCTHQQPSVHEIEPTVPVALAELIDALLEKDPDRRPASATAFLARLEAVVAQHLPAIAGEARSSSRSSTVLDEATVMSVAPATVATSGDSALSRSAYGSNGRRFRLTLGLSLSLLVLGTIATIALLRHSVQPLREPLYVVVARPEIGAHTATVDGGPERLAAAALHAAVLRSLASLDGVVALTPDPTESDATAQRLARVHAADEVLTSSLDCAARQCLATVRRQHGADDRLLAVQSFEVPVDDIRLLSIAADSYLKAVYAGFTARRGTLPLSVRTEDYAHFLQLRRWTEERPTNLLPLLAELTEIRTSSPRFIDAYLLEARLTSQRFFETREAADLDRSFALIDQARQLAPGDPLPSMLWFKVSVDANRLDQAEAAAEELERLVPGDVGGIYRHALLAEATGEGQRALELMRQVVDRRPAAEFLMDLAKMELRQGTAAAARATLEDLLRRIPAHLGGERLLAQVELEAGSPARAAELYTDLLRRRRGFAELSNLGLARLLLRDWENAVASLREASALAPKSAPAALNLADAMTLAGHHNEASALYARVLVLVEQDPAPSFWQTLSVKAQALAHLGRAPEAAAAIQQANAAASGNPQLAYEAALVHALIGDQASALASAEHAVSGGFDRRWFAFPWFDSLRETPDWDGLLDAAEARVPVTTSAGR